MIARPVAALAAIALIATATVSGGARAQSNDEMRRMIEDLQRQLQVLKERLDRQESQQRAQPSGAPGPAAALPAAQPVPGAAAAAPAASAGAQAIAHEFLERKPGDTLTFFTRGGEINLYGNLDLSLDLSTKGISRLNAPGTGVYTPIGNGGWLPAISSNLSYVGVRGFQTLGQSTPFQFVYQLETEIQVSATSGTTNTNSNTSDAVKGGITSRNSFIGLGSPVWGSIKIGKTDAPYKYSTARMNPFAGMLGDYSVIMGNTGGDNRVEFGTRLDHAVWYESPNWHGLSGNLLFAPGQNRAYDSSNVASGESDCSGGNIPGSGPLPIACNDGAFSNAFSTNLAFERGPFYFTAAYELHRKVNRTSDVIADTNAGTQPTGNNPFGLLYDQNDVADEDAFKIGLQYTFPTGTTVSGIWESMRRKVPAYLDAQNERTRRGTWFAISQQLNDADSVHFGWAHAFRTPGDPGQHNADPAYFSAAGPAGNFVSYPRADNAADMFTVALRHRFDRNFSIYANWAETLNHRFAHYDLGAGGRGVTTDCHDASNPDGSGFDPNGGAPRCWTGGHLQGFSVGMSYRF